VTVLKASSTYLKAQRNREGNASKFTKPATGGNAPPADAWIKGKCGEAGTLLSDSREKIRMGHGGPRIGEKKKGQMGWGGILLLEGGRP